MRVEWARFKARVDRWDEEVRLLEEEMRRIIAYFEYKAEWWRSQANRRTGVSVAMARALSVYAERQASTFDGLRLRCASLWAPYLKTYGALPKWAEPYEELTAKPPRVRVMRMRLSQRLFEEELTSASEDDAASTTSSSDAADV